ncbi:hypothetical protein ACQUQP_09235 [Marinobacterium sp. YM272]|uniref:hypothetical protein n=1 Tax=Marinobacterium sp. YM272 TaxID=3421654 RepID=UPI003D7F5970
MKFSKDDKSFVARWISRQFEKNSLFPESCISEKNDGKAGVTKKHIKAYKAWRKSSSKRSDMQDWIDKWLSKAERKALKEAMEKSDKKRGESD